MSKLKMLVVGAGALGRHHARILAGFSDVELVAVCDPRESVGRAVAEASGTQWLPNFQSVLNQIDAASIVVPTSLHLSVGREFLQRGIPLLIEKPLAGNVPEASQLVLLADQHQTILQVGHVERFNPALTAAKRVIGQPKYIRSERLSPFPFRSTDINVVHDVMIHDIDLVLDLVRSPLVSADAFGVGLMGAGEDIVNARLKFENGCVVDLTASRVNPTTKRAMQVWSAIGCVTIDFQAREVTNYSPSEQLLFDRSPVERAQLPGADVEQMKRDVFGKLIRVDQRTVSEGDALTLELREFVDCVRSKTNPSCHGHAALAALHVAAQIQSAIASHDWGLPYQLRDVA